MTTAGFYEQKRMNPRALAVVVLLHGAALTALVLAKGEEFTKIIRTPTTVDLIDDTQPPPPKPPEPRTEVPPDSRLTVTPPIIDLPIPPRVPVPDLPPLPPVPQGPVIGTGTQPVVELPPPPLPPPPPAKIEPARARANLASYVSDADYPDSAIRAEEQGTTRFRLSVGPDGRVRECSVLGSSGSSALDNATCRIMRSRARFTPARDGNGSATTDTVSSAIRWVLPEG
jgi:protein TonB